MSDGRSPARSECWSDSTLIVSMYGYIKKLLSLTLRENNVHIPVYDNAPTQTAFYNKHILFPCAILSALECLSTKIRPHHHHLRLSEVNWLTVAKTQNILLENSIFKID